MVNFLRKNDGSYILLLSDSQVSCDTTTYDSFPVIVSYPVSIYPIMSIGN